MSRRDLEKQNNADLKRILALPEGARFIAGLIHFCGLFDDCPEGGKRDVGLMLYRWAIACPEGEKAYIWARDELKRILEVPEGNAKGGDGVYG
jgi:hypothetical protein